MQCRSLTHTTLYRRTHRSLGTGTSTSSPCGWQALSFVTSSSSLFGACHTCLLLLLDTHTTHTTHQNRLLVLILGSLIFFICFPLCRLVHHTPLLPALLLFATLLSHMWHLHRSAKGALASLGSKGITCSHPSFIAPSLTPSPSHTQPHPILLLGLCHVMVWSHQIPWLETDTAPWGAWCSLCRQPLLHD